MRCEHLQFVTRCDKRGQEKDNDDAVERLCAHYWTHRV